jgi:hypothetical protein
MRGSSRGSPGRTWPRSGDRKRRLTSGTRQSRAADASATPLDVLGLGPRVGAAPERASSLSSVALVPLARGSGTSGQSHENLYVEVTLPLHRGNVTPTERPEDLWQDPPPPLARPSRAPGKGLHRLHREAPGPLARPSSISGRTGPHAWQGVTSALPGGSRTSGKTLLHLWQDHPAPLARGYIGSTGRRPGFLPEAPVGLVRGSRMPPWNLWSLLVDLPTRVPAGSSGSPRWP